jgi:hypothetical protein
VTWNHAAAGTFHDTGSHACPSRDAPARADGGDEDKSGTALAWVHFPSIVIALRGGQAPGQGRRIEDTMPHDKARAAARKRITQTGEPYAAARRAVVTAHQGESASYTAAHLSLLIQETTTATDVAAGPDDTGIRILFAVEPPAPSC